jgi:hypothetical protein
MLFEDTKSCVDHDGDWRRINNDFTAMNHILEKSKWKTWHQGAGSNGEEKVNVWVRDINQAMWSHKVLSVDIYWIKKSRRHGQKEMS